MARSFVRKLSLPFLDTLHGLDRCLDRGWSGLALAGCGLLAGWWIYVPVHELLHAAACRLAGGEVTRLEIDALYGGALLARIFPFVVPASEYAGRLSGFDTGGSDLVYLATDLGPFLLTLFPGVWGLRRAAAARNGLLFGGVLPCALAPFLSLPGDAYEIGSILVTRLPPWKPAAIREALRGDDLLRRAGELSGMMDAPPGEGSSWRRSWVSSGPSGCTGWGTRWPGGRAGGRSPPRLTPAGAPSRTRGRRERWRGRRPSR